VVAPFFKGQILGFVPKSYLSVMETRYFTPAPKTMGKLSVLEESELNTKIPYSTQILYMGIPFGTQILFKCKNNEKFTFAVEIGEDLFAPIPPSTHHALNGATIIVNPSAHVDLITEENGYLELMVKGQSARLACGYISSNADEGESTTDCVYFGNSIICELGNILDEDAEESTEREGGFYDVYFTEIDLHAITHERMRFNNMPLTHPLTEGYDLSYFSFTKELEHLYRNISRTPFLDMSRYGDYDIVETLKFGLKKRLTHTNSRGVVLGVSGGLDSTFALLVIKQLLDDKKAGYTNFSLQAITMPCFGTSERTKNNIKRLCNAWKIDLREIDITESVKVHLREIGHPEDKYDVVFENAQARMRTMVLMNIANQTNSIVVGTGNLSELALGWSTYNGDHMSMYALNAGVPKTVIQFYLRNNIPSLHNREELTDEEKEVSIVLKDILDTPISPELLPISQGIQSTEEMVGPYELHDFFIFHMLRWARPPKDIYSLACNAFEEKYTPALIKQWLKIFYQRFFTQQFKRNCSPDSPAVFPISLSPRGAWHMPSDASFNEWLKEIDSI